MINDIFNTVNELSSKDRSGYVDNDAFNTNLHYAVELLHQYYFERFDSSERIHSCLQHMIVEKKLPVGDTGFVALPSDHAYKLEVGNIVGANDCDGNVIKGELPASRLASDEVMLTKSSAIRKPTLDLVRYEIKGNGIQVYPEDVSGFLFYKYIRQPIRAVRAVTVNTVTDSLDFNEAGSVAVDYPKTAFTQIVDVMLHIKGIEIRESALSQWLISNKQIVR